MPKRIITLSLILAAVLVAAWLGFRFFSGPEQEPPAGPEEVRPAPEQKEKKNDQIHIGLVIPQTGPLKPLGEAMLCGAETALASFRAGLEPGSPKVNLVLEDETSANPDHSRVSQDPRVSVVVGHTLERTLADSRKIYLKKGLPVLLPVFSSLEAAALGDGYFFRMMCSDGAQARALADYAVRELKASEILIIYEDSIYGNRVVENFTAGISGSGGERVEAVPFPSDPEELLSLSKRIAEGRPGAVLLALHARPAIYLAKALVRAEAETTILTTHAAAMTDFVSIINSLSVPALVSLPFDPGRGGPKLKAFTEAYQGQYQRNPNWPAVTTHDAVMLAASAAVEGEGDPEKIKKILEGYGGAPKVFEGLAGSYYFEAGGQGVCPVYVVKVGPGLMGRVP